MGGERGAKVRRGSADMQDVWSRVFVARATEEGEGQGRGERGKG